MRFLFEKCGCGVRVVRCQSANPVVRVPAMYGGVPVVEIGERAFAESRRLETVSLPAGLLRIGARAFEFCEKLKRVRMPDSVVEAGDAVFEGCLSLRSVSLPKLRVVPRSMFEECISLRRVEIPATVEEIGERAFEFCLSLREVRLHSGVRFIGNGCFFLLQKTRRPRYARYC